MEKMIGFVEEKIVDWDFVKSKLALSADRNHYSNFGPVSLMLEEEAKKIMGLGENWCVVATSSGTSALFALVSIHNQLAGRELAWTVSSFGFHCTHQGPLRSANIVDCRPDGTMGPRPDCEAIVSTNVFGTGSESSHSGLVIEDRAGAMDSGEWTNEGIVSFHHTKPWGFGEGGCIVARKDKEELLRSIINFGCGSQGNNGKMSDPAAAFILDRLRVHDAYAIIYREQWDRVRVIADECGYGLLGKPPAGVSACVCLLAPIPVRCPISDKVCLRKYYHPMQGTPTAVAIYDRILNFPCHPGLIAISDRDIREILEKQLTASEKTNS